jgi:hypothetical protein
MTADRGYASPAACRRALTDRLRALAKERKWTLTQPQRLFGAARPRLMHVSDPDHAWPVSIWLIL